MLISLQPSLCMQMIHRQHMFTFKTVNGTSGVPGRNAVQNVAREFATVFGLLLQLAQVVAYVTKIQVTFKWKSVIYNPAEVSSLL